MVKIVVYASRLETTSTTLKLMKMLLEKVAIQTVFTLETGSLEVATALRQETWHLNVKMKMVVRFDIVRIYCIIISIFPGNRAIHAFYSGLSSFLSKQKNFLTEDQLSSVSRKRTLPDQCESCPPPGYCWHGHCINTGKLLSKLRNCKFDFFQMMSRLQLEATLTMWKLLNIYKHTYILQFYSLVYQMPAQMQGFNAMENVSPKFWMH